MGEQGAEGMTVKVDETNGLMTQEEKDRYVEWS